MPCTIHSTVLILLSVPESLFLMLLTLHWMTVDQTVHCFGKKTLFIIRINDVWYCITADVCITGNVT